MRRWVARGVTWCALLAITGAAAGLVGTLTSLLVDRIEHLAFGQSISVGTAGVSGVATWRRLLSPTIGGLIGGLLWWRLRRGPLLSTKQAVQGGRLRVWRTLLDAADQVLVVASGASIGREAAPRQAAAVCAQAVADILARYRLRLSDEERSSLLGAAAGAGLSAVYNVPLAGAVYAIELLARPNLRTLRGWARVMDAVLVSFVATALMRWLRGSNPSYSYALPVRAVVVTTTKLVPPLAVAMLLVGLATAALFRWGRRHNTRGGVLALTVCLSSLATGVLALWQPQVPGNGKTMVQVLLVTTPGIGVLLGMAGAKLLATTVALRSGVAGGMLTPALAIGAATGALVARLVNGRDLPVSAACALIGGAGVLAVCHDAPLFGVCFALELAHAPAQLAIPALVSVVPAWLAAWTIRRPRGMPPQREVEPPPAR